MLLIKILYSFEFTAQIQTAFLTLSTHSLHRLTFFFSCTTDTLTFLLGVQYIHVNF